MASLITMRKYIVIGLLCFPLTASAGFTDVPATHPNVDAINFVQVNGIVSGYPDGSFRPDAFINRAEFTKIIMGAIWPSETIAHCGLDPAIAVEPLSKRFSDTEDDAWYTPFVCSAYKFGIVNGYDDGTFRPATPVTFVEAAKIIAGAFSLSSAQADTVWYGPFVKELEERNAIPVSIQRLDVSLTRGEMAEIVFRLRSKDDSKPSLTMDELTTRTPKSPSHFPAVVLGSVREEVLHTIAADVSDEDISTYKPGSPPPVFFSSDYRRFAVLENANPMLEEEEKKWWEEVASDDRSEPNEQEFDEKMAEFDARMLTRLTIDKTQQYVHKYFEGFRFSRDGKHFAVVAELVGSKVREEQFAVLFDGKLQQTFEHIESVTITDSNQVLYFGKNNVREDEVVFVMNGREQGVYRDFGQTYLATQWNSYAFGARGDSSSFVVLNGKPLPSVHWLDSDASPIFFADGSLAYGVRGADGKHWMLVHDPKGNILHESTHYDSILHRFISRDGRLIGIIVMKGGKRIAVIMDSNGKGREIPMIQDGEIFHPSVSNSGEIAYVHYLKESSAVVGTNQSRTFRYSVSKPSWDADGKVAGFKAAENYEKWFHISASSKPGSIVIEDYQAWQRKQNIPMIDLGGHSVLLGSFTGREYDAIENVMSTEGAIPVYVARMQDRYRVVVGDQECPAYDAIWPPILSADGSMITYAARKGRDILRIEQPIR